MSIEIQKQIKDNATSVSDFFSDLYKWSEDQGKEEKRRELRKTAVKVGPEAAKAILKKEAVKEAPKELKEEPREKEAIKRDGTAMAQYYSDWDRYDPEKEVEKIEDEALEKQQAERNARQAEKDRILDEMAISADGDRKRTSTARPKVKVSVRRSGRRAAPVDLAAPRKEEANRFFAEGRFREALLSYSAALECLDKYQPPGQAGAGEGGGDGAQPDDCAGQESEAIALKVALLANRSLVFVKLEEWRGAVEDCTEALRFDPAHHKAILRRGFALARLKRWAGAARDLEQAVATDPSDKKAAAELKMAIRMLAEQEKEAREHAKAVLCDPTRTATLPTRRLTVKVRGTTTTQKVESVLPTTRPASEGLQAAGKTHSSVVQTGTAPPRQPYIPRSVRIRGRQPGAATAEEVRACISSGAVAAAVAAATQHAPRGTLDECD